MLLPHLKQIIVGILLIFLFIVFFNIPAANAQQKADFSASSVSDCEPLITAFTDLSSGSPVSWQWDFGNGSTSSQQNPSATYVNTGKYTVTLTVHYADGSSLTASKTDYIIVRSKPVVDFSVSANKGCVPFSVTFTDQSKPGDGTLQSYSWDFGDGGVLLNGSSTASHTYTLVGTYNVNLTVTNSYGCTNYKTLKEAVTAAAALNADFTVAEKTFCQAPADVAFTNTSSGTGVLSYKWTFDDGSTSTLKDPGKHTFTTKGTHSIQLAVSNEQGCTATKTVADINVANFSTTLAIPSLICNNVPTTYSAVFSTVQPESTSWWFNGQYVWSAFNDHVDYYTTATGPLTVKLMAVYGNCTDVVEKTVDIKQTPAGQISSDNHPFCAMPATVHFKDNMTGASTWNWDFGDNQHSTQQAPTHIYAGEGNYWAKLTATSKDGCSSNSYLSLDIQQTKITIAANDASGCEGIISSFYTYSNNTDIVTTYLWDFGDGSTSTEANPQHAFVKAGIYTVTLKYTTASGCTGTSTAVDIVKVYKKPAADFTSPDAPVVCGNTSANFIDKSDIGNRWSWNFGDGAYGSGTPAIHSYGQPGTYDVTLTVWNETCPSTITKTAYITAVNPFPRFTVTEVNCNDRSTVTVTENSLGASSWKWSWGDGKDTSYTVKRDTLRHTYAKSSYYNILLTTSDGSCTTYLNNPVTIIAASPVSITTDKNYICSNEELTATATMADPSIYNLWPYRWQLDDVTIDYVLDQSKAYTYWHIPPGKHTVRFMSQNTLGCFDTSNAVAITVRGPIADYQLPAQIQCKGAEVIFTNSSDVSNSAGIATWEWNFGDGSPTQTYTSGPFKHIYQEAGRYNATVKVTDKEGCTNTNSWKYVQVNGPVADFTADYYLVKPGSTVKFSNTSTEVGGYISKVRWDFGDGTTSADLYTTSHYYPVKGLFPVKLHITDDNSCQDEKTKNIRVTTVAAGFEYTSSFVNGSSCAPMVFYFKNTSFNYTSSHWDFGDGGTSNQANPVHTYTESGHYRVILKVKGDANTTDEIIDTIIVSGPYAEIAASAPGGCLEKEISFTIKPERATMFSWDFTDGTVEQTTALEIKHHFTSPGVYQPRLLLEDSNGCKGSAFLAHPIVIDKLDVMLTPSMPKICDQGALTIAAKYNSFSIDNLGMAPTYAWSYDASLTPTAIDVNKADFYMDKAGNYAFNLKVTTAYGCAQTATTSVGVYPAPLASISGPDQACKDAPVNFSGSVTKATDVTWEWNFGNNGTSTAQQPAAQSFATPGNTEVSLLVTSKNGCADTVIHPINIMALPVINASAPAEFICLNNTTVLHAGGGTLYQWTPATGLDNPSIANPKASPTVTTTYQVKVTDANGCVNNDEVKIRVVQPFTITATPDTTLCLGDKLLLRVWGADSYSWQGPGISDPASAAPVATFRGPGQYLYKVTGYDNDGCFSDNTSLTVKVSPVPQVNAGPDREIMAGIPVYLVSNNSSDVTRWRWSPPEYLDCASCAKAQALPNLTTTYHLEVENAFGCKASDDVIVHVLCNQSAIFMPTAFTPNRDGLNEWVYPKGCGVQEIEWLRIYDRWGTLVFENTHFPINSPTAGWDGRSKNKEAPMGTYIYFMQTVCEGGKKFQFKGSVTLVK